MKKLSLLLAVCAMMFTGCREKDLDMTLVQKTVFEDATITAVTAKDAWNVTVVQDERTYVELEYSAFLEEYLKIAMEAQELGIGFYRHLYLPSNTVMNATVHTSRVQQLQFSDATTAVLEGEFPETDLTVELSDAATCKGGRFTGRVDLDLSDAAKMVDFDFEGEACSVKLSDASTLKGILSVTDQMDIVVEDASHMTTYGGYAPQAEVEVSDASSLNLLETEVGTMHITVKDASEASVHVTHTLEGTVKDASELYYKGNPSLNVICDETSTLRRL